MLHQFIDTLLDFIVLFKVTEIGVVITYDLEYILMWNMLMLLPIMCLIIIYQNSTIYPIIMISGDHGTSPIQNFLHLSYSTFMSTSVVLYISSSSSYNFTESRNINCGARSYSCPMNLFLRSYHLRRLLYF